MRQIAFILALLVGFSALGQEPSDYNFIIDESAETVVWQKVYNDACSVDDVVKVLLAGGATNVNDFEGAVSCDYHFDELEYKPLGYTFWDRSIFVRHPQDIHVSVQLKPDRYRVTVSAIVCHVDGVADRQLDKMSTIKTGDYNKKNRAITMQILDYNYDKEFRNISASVLGDDW